MSLPSMRIFSGKRRFLLAALFIVICAIIAFIAYMPPALEKPEGGSNPQNQWHGASPRYIFMFIGDGMGPNQVALAEAVTENNNPLSFTRFESRGIISTHSANSLVTDSAAAATALATGYKTRNGRLGMGPEKQRLTSIAELAKKAGKRIGIITTVSLNHATPAAYYAHISSRSRNYQIGEDLLASGFDYFAGGGIHKHNQKRKADLYELAKAQGFSVLTERQAILRATDQDLPILAINPELDSDNAMPYSADMTEKSLTLAEFVRKGSTLLDNENGFFMMVEGGRIDWAAHANQAEKMVPEIYAFSDAVAVAVDFAAKHPNETLIVVTADHETGGLAQMTPNQGLSTPIDFTALGFGAPPSAHVADFAWTTTGHSSAMVDVYSAGLGSALFRGRYDNTDIAWKLMNIICVLQQQNQ